MRKALLAEALGSMLLAAAVIGSGIMAERLANGNSAIALLANTAATVAALGVLIVIFGPISGAHFNPAVSLIQALRGSLSTQHALAYVFAQVLGCCMGAGLAHLMFELPVIQSSLHVRSGTGQWLSEIVASGGLILVVCSSRTPEAAALRVPAWIGAAYWFTASTSFANPAITIGRAMSNTFAGIRLSDVPEFIFAQLIGALLALWLAKYLMND